MSKKKDFSDKGMICEKKRKYSVTVGSARTCVSRHWGVMSLAGSI